ncbi:hypothetical protein BC829DRAFT_413028 [Chytridium lagenaria]|nr:hypothetical protein BC829DRAFT_413028 [Chytridium lagenaria]
MEPTRPTASSALSLEMARSPSRDSSCTLQAVEPGPSTITPMGEGNCYIGIQVQKKKGKTIEWDELEMDLEGYERLRGGEGGGLWWGWGDEAEEAGGARMRMETTLQRMSTSHLLCRYSRTSLKKRNRDFTDLAGVLVNTSIYERLPHRRVTRSGRQVGPPYSKLLLAV